ncbi:rRNA-processing protein and EBNA1-binding protein ebp2, partial [Rhizophlyctis rosea]
MAKSKSKSKKPTTEKVSKKPPTDLADVTAYAEEQGLEIDADVAALVADPELPQLKKKKKEKQRSYIEKKDDDDEDGEAGEEGGADDEDMTEEDRLEMAAYLDMMRGKIVEGEEGEEEEEKEVKVFANQTTALLTRLTDIAPESEPPFIDRLVITSPTPIPDDPALASDDLKREFAFYSQALHAATEARKMLKKANVPFSRPDDYFAEMIKSDEHMAKVRQRLLDEAAGMKKAEEARKLRDAKKYGKKVQIEKLAERERSKKTELEKVRIARKKRESASGGNVDDEFGASGGGGDDDFGVDVDAPGAGQKRKRDASQSRGRDNNKRKKKDEKFGFGGPKRGRKGNTAESVDDMSGFSVKKMKAGAGKGGKGRPGGGGRP